MLRPEEPFAHTKDLRSTVSPKAGVIQISKVLAVVSLLQYCRNRCCAWLHAHGDEPTHCWSEYSKTPVSLWDAARENGFLQRSTRGKRPPVQIPSAPSTRHAKRCPQQVCSWRTM